MDYQAFIESLQSPNCPAGLGRCLQALWHDARGDWHTAHEIIQQRDDATATRIHAYLHRKEGDDWNARYWYRRTGSSFPERMDSHWMFAHKDGTRLKSVKKSFKSACDRAEISDFHIHDLRHTCAAWLVQVGVSIREVAELLRHSDIRVTMRYAHLVPENVRAAVARLETAKSQSGHTDGISDTNDEQNASVSN